MTRASDCFVLMAAASSKGLTSIAIPEEPVFLAASPRRKPRLTREPVRNARQELILSRLEGRGGVVLLMLIPGEGQTAGVLHNGSEALPVNVLRVGDEIRVNGVDLFVSRQRGQRVCAASEAQIGQSCPLCRSSITTGQRIYSCACGTALHLEGDEVPEADRLVCAELASTCPTCSQSIEFAQGLEWQPEEVGS